MKTPPRFGALRRFPALALLLLLLPPVAPVRSAEPPRAVDFSLPSRDGTVSLSALKDKVVLVDFWASWCGPCRQSFPWLNTVSEHYGASGLVVVAINLDKDRAAAEAFLRELAPRFTVAFDPAGKTAEAFAVKTMPSSYLIGRGGRIVYSHAGFDRGDTNTIENHIKEEVSK